MAGLDPRRTLLERLGVLIGREEAIARHLRGQDGRLEADFGDIAVFTAADEVLEGLEEAALEEVAQVHAALSRLAAGTYGTCAKCGGEIAAPRLEALPSTPFCRACAT
jgi:RNA polymerase-binding transcription factor DksA